MEPAHDHVQKLVLVLIRVSTNISSLSLSLTFNEVQNCLSVYVKVLSRLL
jgi:hypothetical protein